MQFLTHFLSLHAVKSVVVDQKYKFQELQKYHKTGNSFES